MPPQQHWPTTDPWAHMGLQLPVQDCNCPCCGQLRAMMNLPTASAGPIAKASDLCACDGCSAGRYTLGPPSDSSIDVTEAVQRIEQAKEHEAQARTISERVNGDLSDRKLHLEAAAILRKEAADIIAGKL